MNPLIAAHPDLDRVFAVLNGEGEEVRIVGGAVRDVLLGLGTRFDIDLATTALPQEVVRRGEAAGLKVVPTGIEHGTVTLVSGGIPYEVTTLREDVETDGRHARVVFGRDWSQDAARRDFTMNALYMDRDGAVLDLFGGEADARAGRVRFIGDPLARIREDYLRILRLFRFHASYGRGPIDAAALAASIEGHDGLAQLSRERVRAELMKLLVAPRGAETLAEMERAGLLLPVLGSAAGMPDVAAVERLAAIERHLRLDADSVRRLGALLASAPEDVERLREGLRLSNAEAKRLEAIADPRLALDPSTTDLERCAALYHMGAEPYRDRVLVDFARSGAASDDIDWNDLARLPELWTAPKFPLNGGAFLARGIPPGPEVGVTLRRAEALWIERGFPEDPLALVSITRDAMGKG
ncbi:CCA tRNA nucleotidyltransferase [Ancylobacter sp. 6x-1]|uniref:CCA tRNA nucleotidyltransferase n=1 Tax=Ancylobacter crimeensis TaxID=2579147 RepID=A0ABT0D9N3_9HYPH|nr:CCA tRNA nucleotidyltransferase [Ancylobacter crimeensis]MCK0196660.1 CCA tRNA nucleotidyltransferase [Ancylobacter crimeensis]